MAQRFFLPSSFGLVFLSSLFAAAQQNPASQPAQTAGNGSYTLEISTQVVVLDVLVTDKKGHVVSGLTRDDFSVIEDKAPQQIRFFESAQDHPPVPEVNSTAELDKVAPDAAVTILVLDEVTGSSGDEVYTRDAVKRFLNAKGDRLSTPTMLLAVNFNGVMMVQDYTTSQAELLQALGRHHPMHDMKTSNVGWGDAQFNASMHALLAVSEATSGHRGHKNVLWLGSGAPYSSPTGDTAKETMSKMVEQAASELRDARITLYAIDPTGLQLGPSKRVLDLDHSSIRDATSGLPADDVLSGNLNFRSVVQLTGGRNWSDGNNMDKLIDSAVSAGEEMYTLTYHSTNKRDANHLFHEIKIVMKDPNLRASTRAGYFTGTKTAAPTLDAKGRVTQTALVAIGTATRGLLAYDGLPFTITSDDRVPGKFVLHFRASLLHWAPPGENGKETVQLTVVVVGFDKAGKQMIQQGAMATVALLPPEGDDNRIVNLPVTAPVGPPTARLRFVLRSNDGLIGADNFFLADRAEFHDSGAGLTPAHK